MDLYSRKIVGWSMRDDLAAGLVVDAVSMLVARRKPDAGLIHHTDRGSQGGFKWSLQRLEREACDGEIVSGVGAGGAAAVALAGAAAGDAA